MFFSTTIHLPSLFFGIARARCDSVLQVIQKVPKKASKNAIGHPKDHLECSLRPIQATQVTPGPFWTRQKKSRSLLDFK